MQKLMRKFQFLNPSLNVKVKIKKVRIHKHKSMHYCTCKNTTLLDSTNRIGVGGPHAMTKILLINKIQLLNLPTPLLSLPR